jgi:plasmid stability protein
MTNLTISLDENLVKQARIKAIQEGTSLSAKVRELLSLYVRQDMPTAAVVIPKLPISKARGGLRPGSDPCSNSTMYDAMDTGMDINNLS